MREAKFIVLNMINEGKITADEGAKLIAAMGEEQTNDFSFANEQTQSGGFTEPVDDLGAEIRNRLNGIYKDVEPRLKKTVLSALESALETSVIVSNTVHESIRGEVSKDEQ